MYYLEIELYDGHLRILSLKSKMLRVKFAEIHQLDTEHSKYYLYKISSDFVSLASSWIKLDARGDGALSGAIADYIEENMTVDRPLLLLIRYLRERFYK